MHRFFILNKQINPLKEIIPTDELLHQLKKVLRIKENELFICIYEQFELKCKLLDNKIIVLSNKKFEINNKYNLILIQGIPKNKKIPLIIQKATELNVNEIYFWESIRSSLKIKNIKNKIDRYNKIAIEACEQCRRNDIPKLNFIESLDEFKFNNKHTITLYENENKYSLKDGLSDIKTNNIVIIIGPEGGLDKSEIEYLSKKNSHIVTLGNNILRTETAAIAALSIVGYEIENE